MSLSLEAPALAASDCVVVAERIFEFLDGELSVDEDAVIRKHLAACPPCAFAAGRDECFLRFLSRRGGCEVAPPELKARVAAMLAQLGERTKETGQ